MKPCVDAYGGRGRVFLFGGFLGMVSLWTLSSPAATVTLSNLDGDVTAVVDGTIGGTEYPGYANGINNGFGDRIGANSQFFINNDTNYLNFAIRSVNGFPNNGTDGAVLYIDSTAGGFNSTLGLADTADIDRRLVSGMSTNNQLSQIDFAAGFTADYGIYIKPDFVGIFQLVSNNFNFVGGVASNTTVGDFQYINNGGTNLEWQFTLADIGITQGSSFKFVMTLLNGEDAFRADEFVGVSGATVPGGNPGVPSTVTLGVNDYGEYFTVPEPSFVMLIASASFFIFFLNQRSKA